MVNAKIVTEIEALGVLAGVTAVHVASGGIGGSEGSVVLSVDGDEASLEKAFTLVKGIKGESAVAVPEKMTVAAASVNYDAAKLRDSLRG
jgi:hypothetical protein